MVVEGRLEGRRSCATSTANKEALVKPVETSASYEKDYEGYVIESKDGLTASISYPAPRVS